MRIYLCVYIYNYIHVCIYINKYIIQSSPGEYQTQAELAASGK